MIIVQNYFKDGWNTFDFITVIGSIIDAVISEFTVSYTIAIKNLFLNKTLIFSQLFIGRYSYKGKKKFINLEKPIHEIRLKSFIFFKPQIAYKDITNYKEYLSWVASIKIFLYSKPCIKRDRRKLKNLLAYYFLNSS